MYLVISAWKPQPGKEDAFRERGRKVGAVLKRQPGVLLLEVFQSGDKHMSVHGYDDEATYRRLVHDPGGAFARAIAETGIEEYGTWLYSERGEAEAIPTP